VAAAPGNSRGSGVRSLSAYSREDALRMRLNLSAAMLGVVKQVSFYTACSIIIIIIIKQTFGAI